MVDLDVLTLPKLEFLTAEEIQAIEDNEFSDGTDSFELMKSAGKAVADSIYKDYNKTDNEVVTICGSGNNGGDGIIASNVLLERGYDVTLIFVKAAKTEDAKKALETGPFNIDNIRVLNENAELEDIQDLISKADIIIDAILGISVQSKVREPYWSVIDALKFKSKNCNIYSVDMPSGMNPNTGEWHGPKFDYKKIITMGFSKAAFKELNNGMYEVADIGFSRKAVYTTGPGHLGRMWIRRDPDSHKGQNGRVMVIGGSDEFTGAPVLSGLATLRSGIDSLRISVPESIRSIVAGYNPDFIVVKVKGDRHTMKGFQKFIDLTIQRHDVVTIGPGLSNHPHSVKFARELFSEIKDKLRVVLDADAIRAFRDNLDHLSNSNAIITPHTAELRMMLNEEVPSDFDEKCQFLIKKAKELGIIILFKGRIDIITDGEKILLNETGHPGMTVGGTGDVLAGVVAAANCFVKSRFYATAIAAYIMGKAGEASAEKYGNSLLASDVIDEIPQILMNHNI